MSAELLFRLTGSARVLKCVSTHLEHYRGKKCVCVSGQHRMVGLLGEGVPDTKGFLRGGVRAVEETTTQVRRRAVGGGYDCDDMT